MDINNKIKVCFTICAAIVSEMSTALIYERSVRWMKHSLLSLRL